MDISTRGTGAYFGAPVRASDTPGIVDVADASVAGDLARTALEFSAQRDKADLLLGQLDDIEDWSDIWDSSLELALSNSWKEIIANVRSDAAELFFRESVFDAASFKMAESTLAKACPQLSLIRSAGATVGLSASASKKVDGIIRAVTVSVPLRLLALAAPIALSLVNPILAVPGAVLGGLVTRKGESFADKHMNLLSDSKRLATTVLRLRPIEGHTGM